VAWKFRARRASPSGLKRQVQYCVRRRFCAERNMLAKPASGVTDDEPAACIKQENVEWEMAQICILFASVIFGGTSSISVHNI
jgi:hypothetical protein